MRGAYCTESGPRFLQAIPYLSRYLHLPHTTTLLSGTDNEDFDRYTNSLAIPVLLTHGMILLDPVCKLPSMQTCMCTHLKCRYTTHLDSLKRQVLEAKQGCKHTHTVKSELLTSEGCRKVLGGGCYEPWYRKPFTICRKFTGLSDS